MYTVRKSKNGYVVEDHVSRFPYPCKTKAEAEKKRDELMAKLKGEVPQEKAKKETKVNPKPTEKKTEKTVAKKGSKTTKSKK